MSAFERDVVIVGGGHNGLACAAYLARGGLDVLVLERRDVLGGAAATEAPWPGYRVSSASYVVSLMPPQVVRELELKRHGYEVSIITPDYFVPFPYGTSLTLWGDLAKYGRTSEHPYVVVVFPTAHEPVGLAPKGKHLMLAFTQYGRYELREGSWDDHREEYGARVIRTLGEFAPNLEAAVEHIEVLAPRDIEERFGLLGGNIMQGELTPDQMFSFRPIPGYGDYRTPIAGMYLCGSGTHPGGGVMGVPGRNASTVVLRDHRRGELTERLKGFRA